MNAAKSRADNCAGSSLIPVLVAALRSVAHEVTPGETPYSADSYLPEQVRDEVAGALALTDSVAPCLELDWGSV